MTNKPRQIGTAFTTSVVRYLRTQGFGQAELRNLAGRYDLGDIVGIPGVVIECKGGKAAERAAAAQIGDWLTETEHERGNAGAEVGLLVVKRKGAGAQRVATHDAYLPLWQVVLLTGAWRADALPSNDDARRIPVRMALGDALTLLRAYGYGDVLPQWPASVTS
jgi:hypothetical protein